MIIRVVSDARLTEAPSSPTSSTSFSQRCTAVTSSRASASATPQLAEQFGVSRTPVREALQRLREIGVIEASASRFTRVADVTPVQTAQALVVWIALYAALLEEVVPVASTSAADAAAHDHAVLPRESRGRGSAGCRTHELHLLQPFDRRVHQSRASGAQSHPSCT